MQKITPFLWFNGNVQEAIEYYTGIFKNAEIKSTQAGPDGGVFTATFVLEGQEFRALNGGPMFTFNEAVSFFVKCEDQEEVDYYWNSLTANGGEESMCGWLKDRFGLSWQIIPKKLEELLWNNNPEKSQKAMDAMLKMRKIDIAKLEEAVNA